MSGWTLATPLTVGRNEVNAAHPNRDRTEEGTIGDPRHQSSGSPESGGSKHNINRRGRVNAWDCDKDGPNMERLVACWLRHPSCQLVIWNRKIRSRTWGFASRDYGGRDPHTGHAHLEVILSEAAETDARPWGYYTGTKPIMVPAPGAKGGMSKLPVLRPAARVWKASVGQAQRALRKLGYNIGAYGVDFKFGDATLGAVKRFQTDHKLISDGVIGGQTWVALAQGLLGGLVVDGSFGPKTAARVVAFQQANGLAADGLIGPRTWARLIA